jgi:hypothetical protein
MSNVVSLKRPPKPRIPQGPRYFCLQCDGDTYKVLADGSIYCATCLCKTNNLRARYEEHS